MGIYWSVYDNPCPRCGKQGVTSCFISVTPMSHSILCGGCGAEDFTEEERLALGGSQMWSPGTNVATESGPMNSSDTALD